MTPRKSFDELRRQVDERPDRRDRVDRIKDAMRDVLALAELREGRDVTQQELATVLSVTQANVSRIEHQDDLYLSTLRGYVEALGGELQLRAVFPDATVDLDITESRTA